MQPDDETPASRRRSTSSHHRSCLLNRLSVKVKTGSLWLMDLKGYSHRRRTRSEGLPRDPHICMIVHCPLRQWASPVASKRGANSARGRLRRPRHLPSLLTRAGVGDLRRRAAVPLPVERVRFTGTCRFLKEYARFPLRAAVEVLRIHRREPIDIVYDHSPLDFSSFPH
jgi:hypothetical protein